MKTWQRRGGGATKARQQRGDCSNSCSDNDNVSTIIDVIVLQLRKKETQQ